MSGSLPFSRQLPRNFVRVAAHPAHSDDCRSVAGELATGLLGAELEELTRTELIVVTPTSSGLHRMLPGDLFSRLLRRRLAVRILYAAGEEPHTPEFAELIRDGVALETIVNLPYLQVIRDRAVVYLPHQDPRHPMAERLARVRNVVMAGSLAVAFDAMWSMAVGQTRPDAGGDIGDGQQKVLQVLSDGLTDDRAAVRLHMSKRTFARRVAMLMERLNANSRFQAGVQAARRGWV
jgi:DNA-binding CsgD family transcriptional regulator